MANLTFTHPVVGALDVSVNPDSVGWAYNLNTAKFASYAGEVVQILSVYIDDMTVQGQVSSQHEMENIYSYFAAYMAVATQGKVTDTSPGSTDYNQQPMQILYHPRNWQFDIQPLTAPGFWRGRDMVVPSWQITAHVWDNTGDVAALKDLIIAQVAQTSTGDFDNDPADVGAGIFTLSGLISPNSGDPNKNPFQTFIPQKTANAAADIATATSYFQTLIPSYMNGDFSSIWDGIGSSPAFGTYGGNKGNTQPTNKKA